MLRAVIIFAALLMSAGPVAAYTVKGGVFCPDLIKEDANESYRLANKFWVLGYITARNYMAASDTAKDIADDALYQEVLTFCRDNPGKDLDDAAIELYDRLQQSSF